MSATDAILIFLDRHNEIEGWLHLRDGAVVARALGIEGLPPLAEPDGDAIAQVAVVPGEAVALHWLELPGGLAPAQAAAAARLIAADVSAQPLGDMHIAVGPEIEGRDDRAVALVPAITMAGWLGWLQPLGFDPDLVVPEPLLLAEPEHGFVRYDRGATPLYRSRSDGFSVEPQLAELVIGAEPLTVIDHEAFERGLGAAIFAPAVNLRQGAFAKRRRWKIEWATVRRLALVSLAILLVTLAIQLASIFRYTYAADALQVEIDRVASTALPGNPRISNAREQLAQRLADVGGGAYGYAELAASLFAAVQATANAEITALNFDRDGSLRATVQADSEATLAALQDRIRASGLVPEPGAIRSGGGRQITELTVRAP